MDSQTLNVFTQFVDFIKNIDNYQQAVDSIKAATAANVDSVNQLTNGKSLDNYASELDATEQRLILERAEFDKSCRAQNDVLVQRAKDLDVRESNMDLRDATQARLQIEISMAYTDIAAKTMDLSKKESDINAQIDANNQVATNLAARLALIKQAGG